MLITLARILTLGWHVDDLHHSAIGTLAKLLNQVELCWQYEVLVQVVEAKAKLVISRKGHAAASGNHRRLCVECLLLYLLLLFFGHCS